MKASTLISAPAIRIAANVLGTILNDAVNRKLIAVNPSASVEKPKSTPKEMMTLDEFQAKTLLEAAKKSNVHALIATALGSGCRVGELLALRWDDLDLRKKTLSVKVALAQTRDRAFHVKEPKTAGSKRTITLPTSG